MITMSRKKIFLSYSRADSDYVAKLTSQLTAAGQDVWVDNKIKTGQTWDETVEESIRASEVVVVVMSKTSMASPNVMDEVSFGIGLNKTIAPIMIEEVEVPMRLARYQFQDFTKLGLEDGVKKLVSDINFDAEKEGSNDQPIVSSNEKLDKKRSRKILLISVAAVLLLFTVLVATKTINLEDSADDFPINMVEGASTDEDAWTNAQSINSVKSYLDYSNKYSEEGKYLREAKKQMEELFNAEGVVEFSEGLEGSKENKFIIYHGIDSLKTRTPEVGAFIISLLNNNEVNTSLVATDKSSIYMLEQDKVGKVLEVQTSGEKIWCKIAYHQKSTQDTNSQ